MASSTLHFSAGMILGMLLGMPALRRRWETARPVARVVGYWCLLAYGLGGYAVLPAVARRLTGNPQTGSGPGWLLFLGYPLFDRLPLPSIFLGELAIATLFSLQYAVILLAIRRARQLHRQPNGHT